MVVCSNDEPLTTNYELNQLSQVMAFTTPEGDFRAGTLGDLFVPIQKMYAHLFATFVPPYTPDTIYGPEKIHAEEIYARMAACRDKRDFKRFVYGYKKWNGPEGRSPFDYTMYKVNAGGWQLPTDYISDIEPQFSLGHFFPAKEPYFMHYSATKTYVTKPSPSARLVASNEFIKQYITATQSLKDVGIFASRKLIRAINQINPNFLLSKLAGPLPKHMATIVPRYNVSLGCYFDTGVSLKATVYPSDIVFKIGVTHGTIVHDEIHFRQPFDLHITGETIHLELKEKYLHIGAPALKKLETQRIENYIENLKSVKEIKQFLHDFAIPHFVILISYTPLSKKETPFAGAFTVATYLLPYVSRFKTTDFDRSLRNIGLRLLGHRMRTTIHDFLTKNLQYLLRDLDPDKMQQEISSRHPRRGAGHKFFSNGGK